MSCDAGPQGCVWDVELVCDTALLGRGCLLNSDVPGFPAGIHSGVARPSGLEGITGLGGLGLYRDWSWECAATSRSTSDWVTSLWVLCLSFDWVVGAAHTAGTLAVDISW